MDDINIKQQIPKMYQRHWINTTAWAFIVGAKAADPSLSNSEAAMLFQKKMGFTDDEMTIETIKMTYYRGNADMKSHSDEYKESPFKQQT